MSETINTVSPLSYIHIQPHPNFNDRSIGRTKHSAESVEIVELGLFNSRKKLQANTFLGYLSGELVKLERDSTANSC